MMIVLASLFNSFWLNPLSAPPPPTPIPARPWIRFDSTLGFTPSFLLMHRTGKESCWIQLKIDPQHRVCIPHSIWIQWLQAPYPPPLCSDSSYPWRVVSPPSNSIRHSPATSVKPSYFIQTLKRIPRCSPNAPAPFSPRQFHPGLQKGAQKIEILRESTSQILKPFDPLGVLRSLIINEGSSREPLPLLRRLGWVHLISTTGIHIYTLSRGCDRIIQAATFYFRLPLGLGLWLSRIISLTLTGLLWLMSGTRLGMLRPWALILLKKFGTFVGIRWRQGSPLALVILLDPGSFMEFNSGESFVSSTSGRWLYALAVGGGLWGYDAFRSLKKSDLKTHVGLAIGSWILIGFWEIESSETLALATPLLSLISLPIICGLVYPIILSGLFFQKIQITGAAQMLLKTGGLGTEILIRYFTNLCQSGGNLWVIPRESLLAGALVSAFFIFFYFKTKHKIRAGVFFVVFLLLVRCTLSLKGLWNRGLQEGQVAIRVEQLDVGQGDASLVTTENPHATGLIPGLITGLIDAGSMKSISDLQWIELLAERRIFKISWVALSHLDEDHCGGLLRLSKLVPIGCVAIPRSNLTTERGKKLVHRLMTLGIPVTDWGSPCIPFPSLGPSKEASAHKNNDLMGTVWVPLKSGGFYLAAGDATAHEELRIAHWVKGLLQNQSGQSETEGHPKILKISHHGSKTSTTAGWLKALQPDEAWISVGRGNLYHHPAPSTLQLLQAASIPVYRTDRDGALHWSYFSKGLEK